ncbi:MAG: hypothetical protein K2W96_17175 [Gemmataceae bacterium]|nr:hypothetical protein [Gemmataceae bacterium]
MVTFDLDRPASAELSRIRSCFERLGWERLGNTAYRYPQLGAAPAPEDWFNHVLPALMLLRSLVRSLAASGRGLVRCTLDIQSSTGFNSETSTGAPPLRAADIVYVLPPRAGQAFGQARLEEWLDGIEWPYDAPADGT